MTKFNGSSNASQWLYVLKKELAGQLNFGTWLKQAYACLKGCAALWAEQTPKVIQILADKNLETAIIEDKNTFIQLLI